VNANEQLTNGYLNPTACNGTNNLELMVFGDAQRVVINARYDNLGKGAAGAAIQNLNIMLGKQEDLGL
jgi:N-acetyl-gamma-glutamyl-phosphate reductase